MSSNKRQRDAESNRKESPLTREDNTKAPEKSILDSSEVSFPRGGASALTPLELKEVANEATKDVLFAKESAALRTGASDDVARPKKKKKTTQAASKSSTDEVIPSISSLNFKNLIPGTLVLGQVQAINKLDLVLSLPDNLVGFVPITSISDIITKQLEELDNDDSDEDEEQEESATVSTAATKELPKLSHLFKIGQWLRAVVVEGTQKGNKKTQKKRIQLSIEPTKTNKNLELEDLITNATVQVSIKSIEDHGAILDLGRSELGGFISNKELKAASLDPESIKVGSVYLATIANKNDRTATVKFTFNKKTPITTLSSVDSLVPGTLIDALVTHVQQDGLVTRAFGLLDATVNLAHAGAFTQDDLKHKFSIGSNVKARIVAVLFANNTKKLVLSLLNHVLAKNELSDALTAFPIGHVFESVEVKGHDSNYIYVAIDSERLGQVHVSRIQGGLKNLSATFNNGSKHPARVLGFNNSDNYYTLTLDPKVIKQQFLRAEDIPVGEPVVAEVLEVISEKGLKVKIFDNFEAFVPTMHMSDIKLIYPERKFKIGSKVKGRVLNVAKFKNEIIVTLKKSLVGSENTIGSIVEAKVGERTTANVISFLPGGALVSFFGNLKAFLPKSEISETFVRKPEDHLRLGQTIQVRIISVDAQNNRISVSCRLSGEDSDLQKQAMADLVPGRSIVKAQIVEKTKDSVVVELPGSNLRGVIFAGHLSDGNYEQNRAILKRLNAGSSVEGLVLDKDAKARIFNLTLKKSLITAAEQELLPVKFKDVKVSDEPIPGYVKSVTERGVFVAFGSKLVGLILAKYATEKPVDDLSTIYQQYQSVSVRVIKSDEENKRFLLSIKEKKSSASSASAAINPVDKSIKEISDYKPGKLTKAIVNSVKNTQLNVQLADNVQGRIDVSQIFSSFEEIKNPLAPLDQFKKGDVLDVKVIGFQDVRTHTFLPTTDRKSKQLLIELSAKKEDLVTGPYSALSLDKITVGSEYVAFINNKQLNGFFFVNLAASLKGKISLMNVTDDISKLSDIEANFPVGSALKVTVQAIDGQHNSVSLTSRTNVIESAKDIRVGEKYPARVVKVTDNFVVVQLSESLNAVALITDALNDFSHSLTDSYSKNDAVAATILKIDDSNKKVQVSLRSESPVDRTIKTFEDLKRGDVVRGFVKNVTDKGLFVALGSNVTGYVKVSNLFDSYIKEWKKFFKLHQLVHAKVIDSVDASHITLTLKESEVNGDLNVLKYFEDVKLGDIYEGSVRKVADFGVFVKLDGCVNVSGLCHHTQISDNAIDNLQALFGEGDRVKVKVLAVDNKKKQLSLGMKASFFSDAAATAEDSDNEESDAEDIEQDEEDDEDDDSDVEVADVDEDENSDADEELVKSAFANQEDSDSDEEDSDSDDEAESQGLSGLGTNGFDWTAQILDQAQDVESSDDEDFTQIRTKKKKRVQKLVEDQTEELDRAPESVGDFERLIIGNPNSSIAWMNYIAFQLQLSEIEKAREIAERALKTINYREEQEKLNIWIALLNLENSFGTEDTLEDVFKRSCEYMDSLTMHLKLISIYILSEKYAKVDALFKTTAKKFGKTSVSVWVTYGSYLLDREENEKAHEILANALSALPKRDHIEVVRKFAQLEFTKGDAEQGRSLFEGLVADVPKRIDLWNVYIDQEIKKDEKKKVEELFERVLTKKISRKQAKFFFGKWLAFEEEKDDQKAVDYVKAKAQEYVQKNE
ncbi:hypothetical protein WICPIJ_006253 [Wickerhamomyces pijperi]|uniref:S1 motif domain-containing protein n=1 Tax=Wickerhamomyces pijperi TaxID=599730 RepID=A0A9P8Q4N5_WICPI|nr:hypothetical protein WICPIJ_006253 [Wickerhamomyces pijperi]